MRRAVVLAVTAPIMVLFGCSAPLHWTRTGVTQADFHRDSFECAKQSTATRRSFTPLFGYSERQVVNEELYRLCLQSKGYQRVVGGPWVGVHD